MNYSTFVQCEKLEAVYMINIKDAERQHEIAKANRDLLGMQKATMELQKWVDKMQSLPTHRFLMI